MNATSIKSAKDQVALVLTLSALVLLGGCRTWPDARYQPSAFATLELLAPVTIPAGRARAHFQGGKPVYSVDAYRPYCEFEISTVSEAPQQVEPDRLVVRGTTTALLSDPEARLPLSGPFVDLSCGDRIYYEVAYRLASDLQPGVRKLSCRLAFNACWGPGRYPSGGEIRDALGPGFRLQ